MKFTALVAAFAAGASAATTTVSGAAEGFAKGVTGGGTATPVFPTTIAQLSSYLSDSTPRVIVLNKTFDFRGTEGTTTDSGCAPFGTAAACQTAINKDNWCVNYEPDKPKVASITYDAAGTLGLTVASHKTIIGQDSLGIMYGKGLRIVSGATNIIIQNIKIAEINPQWVWGGDGITIDDADMVWIDHVTTEHISRQHIVLGTSASNRVTISNHYLNGLSDHSASCDGYHYWGFYLDGSNDLVTMKNNYIYHTSGRAPKVQGNTVLHAVNNYFQDNSGHAFEIGAGGYVIAEGNVFQNVKAILDTGFAGAAFASPSVAANTACKAYLGHNCELNGYGASGNFTEKTTSFFSDFTGKNVATAAVYGGVAASVVANAGFGKITS